MKRITAIALFLLIALLAGCSGSASSLGDLEAPELSQGKNTSGYASVTILNPQYSYLNFTGRCTITDYDAATIWVRWQICDTSGNPMAGKTWDSWNWDDNWSQYIDGSGLGFGYWMVTATAYGLDFDDNNGYEPIGVHYIWVRKP